MSYEAERTTSIQIRTQKTVIVVIKRQCEMRSTVLFPIFICVIWNVHTAQKLKPTAFIHSISILI